MKKLILILLALCPVALMAQSTDKLNLKDIGGNGALFILNDKKVEKTAIQGTVNPEDIADITVLNAANGTAKYGAEAANGAIIITTKKFAIASYQEKFSDFSADLESYLTSHGTDDKQFIYMIDNVPVPKDNKEASRLMNLPKDKIEGVVFIQDQPEGSKILAKIAITTKK